MALDVYLTNACNLRCKFCFKFDSEDAPRIEYDDVCEVLDAAYKRGHRYVSITGGEPFIYKRVFDVIEYAHQLGFWINILSHGGLLDQEKIDRLKEFWRVRIRISLDGADCETHDALRGAGTFNNTMEKVGLLAQNGVVVGFGATISELNVNRMEDILLLAMDKGATFLRFTPVVRIKLGKLARVTSALHEQMLRTIMSCSIKHRNRLDLPSDVPEKVRLPIDQLTTKRCMAGTGFFGVTSDKRIVPCPLIDENATTDSVRFEGVESLDLMKQRMDDLFEGMKTRLGGICGTCEFRDVCYGGCLAEKLSFDREIDAEQPVCTKLILDKLIEEFDPKDINLIVNSWLYRHKTSVEFSDQHGCMRHAPFWNINLKTRSAWTSTDLRYS
jgi:radical SAM protein with 4Fe4S-binding SPASM domain